MTRVRVSMTFLVLLCLAPLLACAPFLSDSVDQHGQPLPFSQVSWQCPTPSPIPTVQIGYAPTPPPPTVGPGTPPAVWHPTAAPIYSTPVPTATPYIRSGSDYFLGQRIRVADVIISTTSYSPRPYPGRPDTAIHLVTVKVENAAAEPREIHFELLSLIRSIQRADGRTVEGDWGPEERAFAVLGLPFPDGMFPPGTTEQQIAIPGPQGTAIQWGMPFENTDELRTGSIGGGMVWWRLIPDPDCTRGPGEPANEQAGPVGTPRGGAGRWPVPPGTVISRGYGCHAFYTGVRDPACPADAPWWHDGVDFAAPRGTPLFATRAMRVLYAGPDSPSSFDCRRFRGNDDPQFGFGNYLKTQDDAGYTYWYGHIHDWQVRAGQQVAQGRQIGQLGNTGCSTGPHLHFRVRLRGVDRNPFDVIAATP